MIIEFLGKFYDNHSLSIVNRNIVLGLIKKGIKVRILSLDSYDPQYKIAKADIKELKKAEEAYSKVIPDIQVRHSYPPIWGWPTDESTKVVYIQPWEYPKAPFEWQYKFETFADQLIIPSSYCKDVFIKGGINPNKIDVVPNGYNPEVFNQEPGDKVTGIDSSNFNYVYVGNAQWRKGLDILLKAWSGTFRKADKARLIIKDNPRVYGKNNVLEEVIKLQYKTGCAEILYIDDELSDKEMADIYKASDVLVHPYRAEGFAMHVQEAAACGCLPIISANGPTDDFIKDDASIKIGVRETPIDIEASHIFALKPGDSSTLMGSHTFVNEPDVNILGQAMHYIYASNDRKALLAASKSAELSNTWDNVIESYIRVLDKVYLINIPKRLK